MKVYVVCDLEGVAGVIDYKGQCSWDFEKGWYVPYLNQARRLATLELNALVEGVRSAGATEVIAWDGHGAFPGGLDIELLHPECQLLMSAGDEGPAGLDESFAGLFQLGLHACGGTSRAILAHSFQSDIAGYWVDDQPAGEIWMNCYTAGLMNVPCVFLSGDRAATEEALQIVPGMEVIAVKEGLSTQAAGLERPLPGLSLAPEKARQLIRQSAVLAMSKINTVQPFRPQPPFHLKIQFRDQRSSETRMNLPRAHRVDALTIEVMDADQPWLLI